MGTLPGSGAMNQVAPTQCTTKISLILDKFSLNAVENKKMPLKISYFQRHLATEKLLNSCSVHHSA
jgi:hypothetical protein